MLNVSAEWKRSVILDDNRQYLAYADVVLADGKKLSLDNTKFWNGGFLVNDSTSTQGTFTVGALVASKLTIKINNIYDDYSEYDFTDAKVTAYIAKQLESGLEKIKIGEFTISSTSYDGSIITLTCLDNVNKFNKAYNSNLAYPATLYEIVRNACLDCGVPFTMARFPNSYYTVQTKPNANNTYGRVIAYALQICGCFGKCDHNGTLAIGWYDLSLFSEKNYTGGTFSTTTAPYSDGDTLNGGTFAYTDGDSVNGGSYTDRQEYHNIYGSKEFKVDTDDVVITGVKVVVTSQESESKDVEYLSGKTGYVIAINNNPLVGADQAKAVADFVYSRIGGMRFRPFSGSFLSDPTIESGDTAIVNDRKGNAYNTFISNRTFSLGNNTTISCDAESASRNSADKYTADTKAIVEARKTAQKQLSAYDAHMQLLTMLMAQSVGLFKTEQKQDDGSTIYIMHNKADLASSQIQWKMTANGMAVSSDYGKTWNAGVDSSGNAVFNVMSAIGINFDWAHGGTLTLGGENNVNGKQYVKDANGKTLVTLDNKGITLDSSVKIAWGNISDAVKSQNYPSESRVTEITENSISTAKISCNQLDGGEIKGQTFVGGSININNKFSVDSTGHAEMKDVIIYDILQLYKDSGEAGQIYFSEDTAAGTTYRKVLQVTGESFNFVQTAINDSGSDVTYTGIKCGEVLINGANPVINTSSVSGEQVTQIAYSSNNLTITIPNVGSGLVPIAGWSDSRLKKNIKDTKIKALDIINSIEHHSYDFKDNRWGKSHEIGYVAHELENIIPLAVNNVAQSKEITGYDSLKAINYAELMPYVTKAIQELSQEVSLLKNIREEKKNEQ